MIRHSVETTTSSMRLTDCCHTGMISWLMSISGAPRMEDILTCPLRDIVHFWNDLDVDRSAIQNVQDLPNLVMFIGF